MANTTVSLTLNTQADLSGVRQLQSALRGISNELKRTSNASNSIKSVGSAADKASASISGIGSAAKSAAGVAGSSLKTVASTLTSIATTAAQAAAAIAGLGAAGIANGLKNASAAEVDNLMSAGNLGRVSGTGLAGGKALQAQLSAALSSASGGLIDTGISKEFANTFADDVIGAFGNSASSINMSADIANRLATLATLGGADKGQLKDVVIDFMSGALTNATLDNRDILNSTGLTKIIKDELAKSGKALEDLNPAERIELMNTALKKALPADLMQELASTATGQMSVLRNRLFGENGFFSVMRDTLPDVEGNQNVFEQFKKSMALLFNSDGLFAEINRLFSGSGISLDVMAAIRSGWERFNSGLKSLNDWLGNFESIDQVIAELGGASGIGQKLAEMVNKAIESIDAAAVGESIASVLNGIGSFLRNLDWGMIARKFGEGIASFVGELRWDNATAIVVALAAPKIAASLAAWLVTATGSALAGAAAPGAAGAAAKGLGAGSLANPATGLAAATVGAGALTVAGSLKAGSMVEGISQLNQSAANTKVNIGDTLIPIEKASAEIKAEVASRTQQATINAKAGWGQIPGLVSTWTSGTNSAVSTNSASATATAQTGWAGITGLVGSWTGQTTSTVSSNAATSTATAQTGWASIASTVQGWNAETLSTVTTNTETSKSDTSSAWSQSVSAISSLWSVINGKIQEGEGAAQSGNVASAVSSLFSAISSAISSAQSAIGNLLGGGGGGNSATSFVPSAYNRSGGGSLTVQELNIYSQPGEDAQQLAERVLVAIDQKLKQRMIAVST